ncbi:hypothetical protein HK105_203288 [Polyrhizophydium stewartii]|uniref:Large ribosomal subunit protein bL21m n=1 Tax=Polyrhizophydium stewartii TaxID=2732419 RepID=A0ABR4NCJ8_9FUNG|nr:hypothetical protein HK105_005667 [Polyrhizophydium stewartii]
MILAGLRRAALVAGIHTAAAARAAVVEATAAAPKAAAAAVKASAAKTPADKVETEPAASHKAPTTAATGWSKKTIEALDLLRSQTKFHAIVEIKNRPYHVSKNDIIVTPYMKDLALGEVIELDRVREIGSPDYVLQGNPYVHPSYFQIRATVIEHPRSAEIVRKHWKRSGDTKTVRNANYHTLLRVSHIDIAKAE